MLVINVSGKSIHASVWDLALGSVLVFAIVCSQTTYSLIGNRVMQDLRPVAVLSLAVWVAVVLFAVPRTIYAFHFDFSRLTLSEWFGPELSGAGAARDRNAHLVR